MGEVVDLSAAGMRIACRGKPPLKRGHVSTFELRCAGQRVAVTGQAAWVRRSRLLKHEIGVRFVNVSRATAAALHSLALFGFVTPDAEPPPGFAGPGAPRGAHAPPRRPTLAVASLPDYYAALGLQRDATPDEIQAAYRRLARRWHPDVCKEPDAEPRFRAITQAYEALHDPEARMSYDLRMAG